MITTLRRSAHAPDCTPYCNQPRGCLLRVTLNALINHYLLQHLSCASSFRAPWGGCSKSLIHILNIHAGKGHAALTRQSRNLPAHTGFCWSHYTVLHHMHHIAIALLFFHYPHIAKFYQLLSIVMATNSCRKMDLFKQNPAHDIR
jgi:hypothetical protein